MNNTYMKFSVSVFILSSLLSTSLLAQPRCASVLRTFSAEQINLTLEDLARMTLEADQNKVSETPNRSLQMELKKKTDEAVATLSFTKAALQNELRERIAKIQKSEGEKQIEETRVREVQRDTLHRPPTFMVTGTNFTPYFHDWVGISNLVQGRRQLLYMRPSPGKYNKDLLAFDFTTGKEKILAVDIHSAVINEKNNHIVVMSADRDYQKAEVRFLSLDTLQEARAPLTMTTAQRLPVRDLVKMQKFIISEDGDHFVLLSRPEVLMGSLSNIDQAQHRWLNGGLDFLILKDESIVWLTDIFRGLVLEKSGERTNFDLGTEHRLRKLLPLDENSFAVFTSGDFTFIDTQTWTVTNTIAHNLKDVAPIKSDGSQYIVGLEGSKPVLRDLLDYREDSLFDFSILPADISVTHIYPTVDQRSLVIRGSTEKVHDRLWFLERTDVKP